MAAGAQVLLVGLYRRPLAIAEPLLPPQTIISLPVQTAVCKYRPVGAVVVLVAVQLSVPGLYLPPVFNGLLHPRRITALRLFAQRFQDDVIQIAAE